jgi:SAM-dependent methyltransferase
MTSGAAGQQWAAWLTRERDAQADADGKARTAATLEQIRDRVVAGARIRPGDRVVDLGSGTGLLANAAVQLADMAGSIVAIDLSTDALSRIDPPVLRAAATLTQLPLRGETADVVMGRSALIYIDELDTAVSEAARVLRPGGRLSVFEPINAWRAHDAVLDGFTEQQLGRLARRQSETSETVRTMLSFTPERFEAALSVAGFVGINITVEPHRQRLDTWETAMGYLHQRGHAGAATVLEQVTALWGRPSARQYEDSWSQAFHRKGAITFTTPVLYAEASRP